MFLKTAKKSGYDLVMAIFQCPVCELRFSLSAELDDHLNQSHPDFKVEHESAEDELLAEKKRRRRDAQS